MDGCGQYKGEAAAFQLDGRGTLTVPYRVQGNIKTIQYEGSWAAGIVTERARGRWTASAKVEYKGGWLNDLRHGTKVR